MPIVREFALQSIFFITHCMVIMGGSMFTATFLKLNGYPEARPVWPWLPVFIRNWGVVLILIPAVWVLATIWLERHCSDWFSKRWTILSGAFLLAALAWFMFRVALISAGGSLIQAV
jgi:hypothetical protein